MYEYGAVILKYYVHIDPSFMQKMIPCMLVLIVLLPAWQAGLNQANSLSTCNQPVYLEPSCWVGGKLSTPIPVHKEYVAFLIKSKVAQFIVSSTSFRTRKFMFVSWITGTVSKIIQLPLPFGIIQFYHGVARLFFKLFKLKIQFKILVSLSL